ncbi:monothiol glutaredoxin-4 [Diplodia corticola]|uniref:Monothiol glutaredoxin-4 n=1 Tax=Diplodia corticola TaxID=236234 RepID=A0A1J9QPN3_9PEZI|nr:monothiol glutaredoxin-4 [Diplodia corticola]OJD30878.1 monothiol glutaredoxin-4 [Diplodia corticola]
MSAATVTEITTDADFAAYVQNFPPNALLVVYFHAPWAAPCKQMTTVLEALASTYTADSPPSIGFVSINAEELPDVSEAYDVTAVPYIVLQKGGQTLETVSGSDASKVRAAVERHAGKSGNPGKLGLPPAQAVTKPAEPNGSAPAPNDAAAAAPAPEEPETSKEELFARLEGLVKAAPVMLFMKGTPSAPQCGFSRQTVSLLREKGVRYGFFNILADDEVRQGLKEYAEWPTFPQLWVGGELVGGLDIVREEFENSPDFLQEYAVSTQRNTASADA